MVDLLGTLSFLPPAIGAISGHPWATVVYRRRPPLGDTKGFLQQQIHIMTPFKRDWLLLVSFLGSSLTRS